MCHTTRMVKMKSKKSEDIREMAYSIARAMSRETALEKEGARERDLTVGSGLLGDPKAGKTRAQKLTPEERKVSSTKAARKRWLR